MSTRVKTIPTAAPMPPAWTGVRSSSWLRAATEAEAAAEAEAVRLAWTESVGMAVSAVVALKLGKERGEGRRVRNSGRGKRTYQSETVAEKSATSTRRTSAH